MRDRWFGLALLTLLGAGMGCNRNPAVKLGAGNTSLPSGWEAGSDPESGVSLGVPAGWRAGLPRAMAPDPMASGGGAMGDGGAPVDPALAQMLDSATQSLEEGERKQEAEQLAQMREREGIILHYVNSVRPLPGEMMTRFFVRRVKHGGNITLDQAVGEERAKMTGEDAGQAVDLPAGKAWRLFVKGRNRIGDEETHIAYVFIDGSDAYVLRFGSVNNPTDVTGIEREVAATFGRR